MKCDDAYRTQGDEPCEIRTESDVSSSKSSDDRLRVLKGGAATLALATAACGPDGILAGDGEAAGEIGTADVRLEQAQMAVTPITDAEAARFVLHASLSVSMGDIRRIKSIGKAAWLNEQIAMPHRDTAHAFYAERGYDRINAKTHYLHDVYADNMAWNHLIDSREGVRKRVAFALSEFFVVSLTGLDTAWKSCTIGYYWDTLNKHAFGKFRDLLEAITLNPAMGAYLNMKGNQMADPATGRVPDENYAREILQLFSIGLHELNLDGTPKLDGAGNPIETYTNDDITGLAKAFTGYDFDFTGQKEVPAPSNPNRLLATVDYYRQPMTADPAKWRDPETAGYHSLEEKRFLGTVIPAGTGPNRTLRLTLDAIFNHPNVGPFFGKQMIQRLVTSNPSPAYVRRVARVFNDNGNGRRGDLRAVFKAILLDEEANSPETLAKGTFGKLREPALRFAQFARTFRVSSKTGAWDLRDFSDDKHLGQSPLRSPSVFNYFRPGYQPPATKTSRRGLLAPEFQIVNEASVAAYVNFMERSVFGRAAWMRDVVADFTIELRNAHRASFLLDRFNLLLTANQLSDASKDIILSAMEAVTVTKDSPEDVKLERIKIGIFLTLVSNDYLVQR